VDTYHALGAIHFSLSEQGLEDAYIVGGGYKYLQLGEGNCFLRTPPHCTLRPVNTGWFADFEHLDAPVTDAPVGYSSGDNRFAGATYDPVRHYRAASVMDFFERQRLDAKTLRAISQHQMQVLRTAFDALDCDPADMRHDRNVPLQDLGGFFTLKAPRATELVHALRSLDVFSDARGDNLRLGPAPYLSDEQLASGVNALPEALRRLRD
jgi:kynureninase